MSGFLESQGKPKPSACEYEKEKCKRCCKKPSSLGVSTASQMRRIIIMIDRYGRDRGYLKIGNDEGRVVLRERHWVQRRMDHPLERLELYFVSTGRYTLLVPSLIFGFS